MKKNVIEIRRERLRELMRVRGGPGALAKKLGYSSGSYLSQVAGPTPTREISERVARAMEQLLGLAEGYLDQPGNVAAPAPDASLIGEVYRAVTTALEEDPARPPHEKVAEVLSLAHEHATAAGRVDQGYVRRLIKLAR